MQTLRYPALFTRTNQTNQTVYTRLLSCTQNTLKKDGRPLLVLLRCGAVQARRYGSSEPGGKSRHTRSAVGYIAAAAVFMIGATYAGVPLYRMLCQTTGLGGEVQKGHDSGKVESMRAVENRVIRVRFNADTSSSMQWNFRPHQSEIKVLAGETALAFYKANNPTDQPVVGISTYNVVPFEAAQYFNKIQCFCFEEQMLNPHEEVDLPVFFYIDPEFCEDPRLEKVDIITLSYTFFEAKEGMTLPPVFNYVHSPSSQASLSKQRL